MKIITKHILTTLAIYILCYLFYTFCVWRFDNPIQWIIDIPKQSSGERFLILFFWLFYHVISMVILYAIEKDNKRKNLTAA